MMKVTGSPSGTTGFAAIRQRLRSCWPSSPNRPLPTPRPPEAPTCDYGRAFYLDGVHPSGNSGERLTDLIDSWHFTQASLDCLRRQIAAPGCLFICAEASGAGKTRLLRATLRTVNPAFTPIYLRGNFETFRFLAGDRVSPAASFLVANEISPHLDVYLWGSAARRVLTEARRGWTLWTTAHAGSEHDFHALLDDLVPADPDHPLSIDVLLLTHRSGQVLCDTFLAEH